MHLLILLLHSTCILSAYYVSRTEEETKEMRLSLSSRICHLTEKAWNKSYLQKQSFVLQREEGWAGAEALVVCPVWAPGCPGWGRWSGKRWGRMGERPWGAVSSFKEKEMATHSSILAWRILWIEEPGGLLSIGSHRVGHDWSNLACTGEGNGNPLQYSCLENPRGRGAWWATVCGVAQSWTRLKRLSSSAAAAAAASRKSRRAEWRAVNSESHQIFLVRAEWGMVVDYSGWSMLRLKKTCISLGLLAANLMWELVAAQVTTGGAVTGRKTGPPCIKSVVGCVWCFISASFSGLTVVCFPASTLSGIVISSNYRPLI